jgi:hypothetical protein
MLRKKANIRRLSASISAAVAPFLFILGFWISEYPTVVRLMSMLLVFRILTLGYP